MRRKRTREEEEFRLLKNGLSSLKSSFRLALERCPELERFSVKLLDGREVDAHAVFAWLEAARAEIWKYGPPEVQQKQLHKIVRDQPCG